MSTPPKKQIEVPGAVLQPIHGTREVNIYPIQEHELTTIGICSFQVTLWSSVASASLALIASCLWDIYSSDTSESKAIPFVIGCAVVTVFSALMAYGHWRKKGTEISKIKSETKS